VSDAAPITHGRCLCGAVRFTVEGPLRPVVACHCNQCRKTSGHHVAATAAPREAVRIEGAPAWYESSPGVRRGFCGTCGSPLFWDASDSASLSIFAGALELDGVTAPDLTMAGHINVASKPAYYAIADGLPQTQGADPALTTRTPRGFCVAIDGPAAAGKGTIGKALAARFGFAHLDTGALYRAVAARMIEEGEDLGDAAAAARIARFISADDLQRGGLRSEKAGEGASRVAAVPAVRRALLEFQRSFSRRPGGAVLDGRDIGTVVRPDAEVKLYVTASDEARARRRAAELNTDLAATLTQLRARDARDASRAAAPMKPADDAHLIDTTDMTIDAATAAAAAVIEAARSRV
jgi:cytidylate kinase